MGHYDFSSIFSINNHYRITKAIRQSWNNTSFSYENALRPDHGILLLIKGHIRFDSDQQLTASPGDLIYLPKGIHYTAQIPQEFGDTEDYLINFDITSGLTADFPNQPIKLFRTENREFSDLFDRISVSENHWQHSDLYMLGQFYIIMDRILQKTCHNTNTQTDFLKNARFLLTEHNDVSIEQIAKLCGVSESSLRSKFRDTYGISPQQYRMNIRIERAKYLLDATDLPLYDITEELGFYDMAYFCKVFRKYTGLSPRQYSAEKTI